ncbi:lipase 3-like isoform X1 [Haematobia irritans]|uniref:lipase 3-like isoform X1 n=1 Tax=Haematobia irritans TaxID=7368 RepID=UPI003F50240C
MQVHLIFVVPLVFFGRWSIAIDTCDRITQHKYPCERHTLTTKDGYILTLFRIPQGAQGGYNSAHPANMTRDSRPVIMLLHGVECSSDSWIISGPENGLPFVLADAGYDVWLPNNRGNIYSERHVSLPSTSQAYWQFSIDEIGSIDVPTIIDFILAITKMQRLHFVGHSQGVTAFMMALASNPSYNRKISTSHLLGPAIFVCHARGPFPPILAPILGSTTGISKYLGNLPSGEINARLQGFLFALCQRENYENFCVQILNSFLGWDSPYLNRCHRITRHGYPCESHSLTTSDGYILTMVRIPHSHRRGNDTKTNDDRPAVLMMHCWHCSSDIWTLNGPDNSLAFLLVDAGYDVWLGNSRGNVYSRKHISLSSHSEAFWTFALDEIGQIDVPAKMDYILHIRNLPKLHYVGYSQGTAALVMALSTKPLYTQKLHTVHLLAPAIFVCHITSLLPLLAAPIIGQYNAISTTLGTVPPQNILSAIRTVEVAFCKSPQMQLFVRIC